MPFNGSNPRSVAVMNNLSVHHVHEFEEHFRQAGIVLLFLPAYSPHLNPMEEAFSFITEVCRLLVQTAGNRGCNRRGLNDHQLFT